GFCMGVRRAVNMVYSLAKTNAGKKIYTYGPLIHNPKVLENLDKKGISSIGAPEEADKNSIIVIRAHGVPPQVGKDLAASGAEICNATCPDVMKVQGLIKKYAGKDYLVVIVGDKGHAEVTGLMGFSNGKGIVISSVEQISNIPAGKSGIAVLAQTTQDTNLYSDITAKILVKFPDAKIFNTICKSTLKRQEETTRLAKEVNAMIVLGGKNSANTRRLFHICKNLCADTFYVEKARDLDMDKILKYKKIGITAGASTPNWQIKELVTALKKSTHKKRFKILEKIDALIYFIVRTNIFIAIGAGVLSYMATKFLKLQNPSLLYPIIAGLYVFSMHTFNKLFDKTLGELEDSTRIAFFDSHHEEFKILSIAAMACAIIASLLLGFPAFLITLIASVAGISYSTKFFPKNWPIRRLKDIQMSKDLFVSLAWTSVTVFLPLLGYKGVSPHPIPLFLIIFTFLYIFMLVFIRCLTYDLLEIHADRMVGRESLVVCKGKSFTKRTMVYLTTITAIMVFAAAAYNLIPGFGYFLPLLSLYSLLYLALYHKRHFSQEITFDLMVDGKFIIGGIIIYLWTSFAG
ncbi:MAG: 4-hydroxy-3-methylbut-2-enyl diphosphate reductase, partial [Candidatus Aureabacteria bacterium]|nr:4-hydroxy-3-methylbut-2-enyl diphosphate reductase [Candidatus Auribacterota bacterium]